MEYNLDYKPEPNQEIVHQDRHKYRVVCAGRKFGKSVLARSELWMRALLEYKGKTKGGIYQPGNYWIVSPTIKQGRQNHWRQLLMEIPSFAVASTRQQPDLQVELKNGAFINILGAENADKIRGAGVVGMVIDEAAFISSKVWELVLEPELYSTKGWALFISTPRGHNWFEDIYRKGQGGHPDWKSWRFTSYDTPRAEDKERRRFLDDKKDKSAIETFAQEYLADFTHLEGLIYKPFSEKKHVIEPVELQDNWYYFRAIDWGGKDPNVVLFCAVTPEKRLIIYDEIYETDITTADLAEKIRARSFGRAFENTFADPSGYQRIKDLDETHRIPVEPASRETKTTKKSWINFGIDKITEKLIDRCSDGEPALQVFDTCENIIREFSLYSWKENPDPDRNSPGIPEDANNHAMDALRYIIVSYENAYMQDNYEFPEQNLFTKGGFY